MSDFMQLLQTTLGDGVEVVAAERLQPWFVARVHMSDGSSVIVKSLRTDAGGFRTDPAQVLTELCALRFLEEIGFDLVPRIVASNVAENLIVLEDLGPRPSLFDLLRDRAPSAADAETAFARALGDLHASTVGLEDVYYDRRRALGPVDPQIERVRYLGRGWNETRGYAEKLGARPSSKAEADMAAVMTALADPGPFLAFSNGDACAFNFLVDGVEGALVDFEFAGYRHAVTDFACVCSFRARCGSLSATRPREASKRNTGAFFRARFPKPRTTERTGWESPQPASVPQ